MKQSEAETILAHLAASIEASHRVLLELLESVRHLLLEAPLIRREPTKAERDADPEIAALDDAVLDGLPDAAVFTVQEVAGLLRTSPNTVYEMVRQKQLPSLTLGRQIRIGRRGLVAFLRGMDAPAFDAFIRRKVEERERKKLGLRCVPSKVALEAADGEGMLVLADPCVQRATKDLWPSLRHAGRLNRDLAVRTQEKQGVMIVGHECRNARARQERRERAFKRHCAHGCWATANEIL